MTKKGILLYQNLLTLEAPDKIICSEAAGGAAIYVYCPKHYRKHWYVNKREP